MPELPEVETIKRDLEKLIIGKKIKAIEINNPKPIKEPAALAEFKKSLLGGTFKGVSRRGKLLICALLTSNSRLIYMVVHLRLTGQLVYGKKNKESRVNFLLSGGEYLNFNDSRLLGEIRLVNDYSQLPFVKAMGPEPLERDFTLKRFETMLKVKKARIKSLLMDQKFIAGIGNIYAIEMLFSARIHPLRAANTLKNEEIKKLYQDMRGILKEAIKHRGSSVDTYRDASGEKGTFDQRLQVYGRKNKPCFKCKTPIQRIVLGGRGTYLCPHCQK